MLHILYTVTVGYKQITGHLHKVEVSQPFILIAARFPHFRTNTG